MNEPLPSDASSTSSSDVELVTIDNNDDDNVPSATTTTTIAFGSCHKNRKATTPPIWDAIAAEEASTWIWMGDAVYPPGRDPNTGEKRYAPAPPEELREYYHDMKTGNWTVGYHTNMIDDTAFNAKEFGDGKPKIYGTWDDHDYGGNDCGAELDRKEERRQVFWDFLGYNPHEQEPTEAGKAKEGVYHTVYLEEGRIQVILLDTRWFREDHCIPSLATKIPMGNAFACATRWLTAGLRLDRWAWLWGRGGCAQNTVLGDQQWAWFQDMLAIKSQPSNDVEHAIQLRIVVSSIQVWTTNPAMESWGQFPTEQARLWNMLQTYYKESSSSTTNTNANVAPIMFWSGDVHHGEISGQSGYLEVTSSGLTHHCGQPKLYGRMCRPLLETFRGHRHTAEDFYIGLNYGVMTVDWTKREAVVQVKDSSRTVQLEVVQSLDDRIHLPGLEAPLGTLNGHLIPVLVAFVVAILLCRRFLQKNDKKNIKQTKKAKKS